MKRWYKYLVIIMGGLLLCGGCSKQPSRDRKMSQLDAWMRPQDKLKVLSTTAMIDYLVSEIGQEHLLHMVLIQGQLDPHSYELVKGDNEKISCADIVFYNGLELEHGASLKYQLMAHPHAYALGEMLARDHKNPLIMIDKQVDPHIWMDLRLFSSLIDPMVTLLSEKDPEHATEFQRSGEMLRHKMLALDTQIYQRMQAIPEKKRYLITSHDAFFYFTKRYLAETQEDLEWEERFAAPEGLAPDGQISPKDLQSIIHYAAEHEVKVIFPESNLNQDALKKIVAILNAKGEFTCLASDPLYGDTIGEPGSGADNYLKMMEYNARVIEAGLMTLGERHE